MKAPRRHRRTPRALLAIACAALAHAGCAQSPEPTEDTAGAQPVPPDVAATLNVAVAQDYDLAQHHREAVLHYEAALRLDPDNHPTVHRRLGALYALLDEPERAREAYRKALRLDPNNAPLLREAGAFELAQARPEDAEPLLQRAVEINPAFDEAWISLGAALAAQRRYAGAMNAFEHAMDPAEARANLALAMGRNADFDDAREQMRLATRGRPDLQRYNGALDAMRAERAAAEADEW